MKIRTLFFSIIIMLISINLFAIPADNHQITKKQSNGKSITFTLKGDEFISWATSIDNYTLIGNTNGELVYAIINEKGDLVASSILATNPEERTIEEKLFLNSIKPNLFYSKTQLETFKNKRTERKASTSIERAPTTGTPNFLVILVNFSDITFGANNATTTQNQIIQTNYTSNGATGSVKDYFFDNSMGVLNANFTVVGPFTLPHNQAYYGAHTSTDYDALPQQMAYDAANLANSTVNFANFDNDNDGVVDMVHIIYAGRGENNGGGDNAVWAHAWTFPSNTSFDGVSLSSYSCSPELNYNLNCDGIGAICHEMGHVLGLPDFYDTDYSSSGGTAIHTDVWDVMSSGSYNNDSKTPPYYSAEERNLLGWLTPNMLTTNNTPCTLPAISDSNKAYKLNLSSNEFLIFEHRNQKKWDAYTPAKGMLIFHGDQTLINHWINGTGNDINVNPSDRGFFIVPATGDSSNISSTNTTFPGSSNISSFLNTTLKNGTTTGKAITNIAYGNDSIITFNYVDNLPVLLAQNATNISTTSATLNGTASGSGIITMGIEYRVAGTSTYTSQTLSSSPLQFTLNNLSINTSYEYRVFATTGFGTFYSNIITFQTLCSSTALTLPLTEDFEGSLPCWTYLTSNSQYSINFASSGNNPNCSTHGGSKMLSYNSYNISSGSWAAISTSMIYFPNQFYKVGFWIYRYKGNYSSANEGVEILINSNPSLNGATSLGFISNNRNTSPTVSSNGWYNYSFNLPSGTYGNKYIIIKAISDYGYNIYIDDLSINQISSQVPPMILIDSISNITTSSSTLNASYIQGSDSILSKGFEYKLNNSTSWSTITTSTGTTPFTSLLSNLTLNTKYNVRAFVSTQTEGTTYSIIDTFTTASIILPILITQSPTNISSNSATLNSNVTIGSEPILTNGFEYKTTSQNWSNAINALTTSQTNITQYGYDFNLNVNSLTPNTEYNVRAYVTTSTGTTYGDIINFTTTQAVQLGEVTTLQATNIMNDSATLNGNLVSTGNALNNIEIGFVYSTIANPLIGGTNVTKEIVNYISGMTTFNSNIINLQPGTSYFYKAYIINSAGTNYGLETTFATLGLNKPINNTFSIQLYPNPAKTCTKLYISGIEGQANIILSDVQGRIINNYTEKSTNGIIEKNIDLSNITKGVYFIKVYNSNTNKTQKLIVE